MQNIQGRKIFRRCHTHSPDCDPDLTEGGAVSYWIVERWVQVPHAEAGKQKTAHWSSYDIFQKAAFGVLLKLLASCSLGHLQDWLGSQL